MLFLFEHASLPTKQFAHHNFVRTNKKKFTYLAIAQSSLSASASLDVLEEPPPPPSSSIVPTCHVDSIATAAVVTAAGAASPPMHANENAADQLLLQEEEENDDQTATTTTRDSVETMELDEDDVVHYDGCGRDHDNDEGEDGVGDAVEVDVMECLSVNQIEHEIDIKPLTQSTAHLRSSMEIRCMTKTR